jgi:transcriptional regulator with XRE-family HTH domain
MVISMKIGVNIKFYRELSQMTQQELAEKVNSAQTHIAHIEGGHRSPSFKMLYKIAQVLGCLPADLLREDADPAIHEHISPTKTLPIIIERGEGPDKIRIELPPTPETYSFLEKQLREPQKTLKRDIEPKDNIAGAKLQNDGVAKSA